MSLRKDLLEMLPGGVIDDAKFSRLSISRCGSPDFNQIGRFRDGPIKGIVWGYRTNGKLTAYYEIIINTDSYGNRPTQEPPENIVYGVLHEVVEWGIMKPPPLATRIAQGIRQKVEEQPFSTAEKELCTIRHLEAVVAEYIGALSKTIGKEGLLEAGRLHRTTLGPQEERIKRARHGLGTRRSMRIDGLTRNETLKQVVKAIVFNRENLL